LNDQNAPTLIFFPPTTRVWRFTLTNFLPLLVSAIGKLSSLPPSLSPEAELLQVLSLKPSTIISYSTRSQRTTSHSVLERFARERIVADHLGRRLLTDSRNYRLGLPASALRAREDNGYE
jgi:hypothetical protein